MPGAFMYVNWLGRCERLIGLRAINGLITRLTTSVGFMVAGFTASFTGASTAFGVSTTDFTLASGFVINFLVGFSFIFDFDVTFFSALGFTAAFALTFDFTAITHILSWIIETPSASFITDTRNLTSIQDLSGLVITRTTYPELPAGISRAHLQMECAA
jgi:hypothetical protein